MILKGSLRNTTTNSESPYLPHENLNLRAACRLGQRVLHQNRRDLRERLVCVGVLRLKRILEESL